MTRQFGQTAGPDQLTAAASAEYLEHPPEQGVIAKALG